MQRTAPAPATRRCEFCNTDKPLALFTQDTTTLKSDICDLCYLTIAAHLQDPIRRGVAELTLLAVEMLDKNKQYIHLIITPAGRWIVSTNAGRVIVRETTLARALCALAERVQSVAAPA